LPGLATNLAGGLVERRSQIAQQWSEGFERGGGWYNPIAAVQVGAGNVGVHQGWEIGKEFGTGIWHVVTKEIPAQFVSGWRQGGGWYNPFAAASTGLGNVAVQQVVVAPVKGAFRGGERLGTAVRDWWLGIRPPGRGPFLPPAGHDHEGGEEVSAGNSADDDEARIRAEAEQVAVEFRDNRRIREEAGRIAAERQRQREAAIAAAQREAAARQAQFDAWQAEQAARTIQQIFDAFGSGGWGGGGHSHDQWGRDVPRW
jgi:hypothetical protein